MPPSTRSGGKAPPSRVYHSTPTLKQVQFPARRRVVKSYSTKKTLPRHDELPDSEGEEPEDEEEAEEDKENGGASSSRKPNRAPTKGKQRAGLRDPKQKTLTQIDFVSSSSLSDVPLYAMSESEPPTPQKPVVSAKGKKKTKTTAKAKTTATRAKRRRTVGGEAEEEEEDVSDKKGKAKGNGKRRRTMGDTPWHTQTLTQFYPRDAVVQDSEDDGGFDDWLADSPSKPKKAGKSPRKVDLAEYDADPSEPPRRHASALKTKKITWTKDPSASAAEGKGPETPSKRVRPESSAPSPASVPRSIELLSRYGAANDKPTPSKSSGVIRELGSQGTVRVGKMVIEDSFGTASWDSPVRPVGTPLKDITEDVVGEMASPSRGRGKRRMALGTLDDGRESNKENQSVKSDKDDESDMGIMMEIPDSDEEGDFSEGDDTIVPGMHQAEPEVHHEETLERSEGAQGASAGNDSDGGVAPCDQAPVTEQKSEGEKAATTSTQGQSAEAVDAFERTSSEVAEVSQPLAADISQFPGEELHAEQRNLECLVESTSELSSAPPTEELQPEQGTTTRMPQSPTEAPRKTPKKLQVTIDDNPVEIQQPLFVDDSEDDEDEAADDGDYNTGLEKQHALDELASSTDDFAKSQSSREPNSTGQQPQHSTPPTETSFQTPARRLRKPLGAVSPGSLTQPLESQRIPRNIIQALVGEPDTTTDVLIPLPDTQLAALISGHSLHVSFPYRVPVTIQRLWFLSDNLLRYGGIAHPHDETVNASGEKQYRYYISQVVELNNPHDEESLRHEEWIFGPIGRYQYLQPGPIQSILANLQRALFRDDAVGEASDDEDDENEQPTQEVIAPPVSPPPPAASGGGPTSANSSFSISQQVEAQLMSDMATHTTNPPSDAAAATSAPPAGDDDILVPSTPLKRHTQHLNADNDTVVRASQATTASQASTPSQTPGRSARAARTPRSAAPTLRRPVTQSSGSTVAFPELSSPPYLMNMSSAGRDGSLLLRSSQLLTRSQMLPDSLIRGDDRAPPVIWDSDGEGS
ncbi:uncharacterized protein F5Z01DRAFT_489441 [Emericellopsis atlantica]|uniref:Uncharacterized protein n=1 Tax=Emericellopsis atlantica TaxID=2614577 RepID=A0A9P7ZR65_9HYPO|nr:uncharacterized protein F5Z01DRAFT_489441 [Emericellopsis atlantica]KAG9256819.1 hypothetical protein F5Z01DRAFT_489441 [Emericellopsis atlantica]